jgi:hypothetical protein
MGKVQVAQRDGQATTIAGRLQELWDAYRSGDAERHNAILADDYESIHPDGSIHRRRPTAGEIAAAPLADYLLDGLEVWPVAPGCLLARYAAHVTAPGETSARHHWVVAEVWLERDGAWVCRHYQPTSLP